LITSFIIAAILIELTPGPNMTWLAVTGANHGVRVALAAVAGICLGLAIAALIAGLGLTTLLYEVPQLLTALRWAGTLYLFYLAWEAWNAAEKVEPTSVDATGQAFTQGLISNILNPKAYLFYAVALPQFIDVRVPAMGQVATLSAIYVAIATAIHAGIAVAAGRLADWLMHSPQAVLLRRTLAGLIAGAACWFFYSTGETM
jgi:threonine/homoserine/homoserine lactone efflux protein